MRLASKLPTKLSTRLFVYSCSWLLTISCSSKNSNLFFPYTEDPALAEPHSQIVYSIDLSKSSVETSGSDSTDLIEGSTLNLSARSERLLSYRHQERMHFTEDGGLHSFINNGSNGSRNNSLMLFSSYNEGSTWSLQFQIPQTGANSSVDTLMLGDTLYIAYSTTDEQIAFASLRYNPQNAEWSLLSANTVYLNGKNRRYRAHIPTLTIDSLGRFWIAFTETDYFGSISKSIVCYSEDLGQTWNVSNIDLLSTFISEKQSVRLISLKDRIGIIFTKQADDRSIGKVGWAYRLDNSDPTEEWITEIILELDPESYVGRFASHFSTLVDPLDNIHVAIANYQYLEYLRFDGSSLTWDTARQLSEDNNVEQMQISMSNENELFIIYDRDIFVEGKLISAEILRSIDYGLSFSPYKVLIPPSESVFDNISSEFDPPMIDSPLYISSYLPIFQSFRKPDGLFGLRYFKITPTPEITPTPDMTPTPEVTPTPDIG